MEDQTKKQITEQNDGTGEDREITLEELFAELDGILENMNDREVTLEDAFSLYEKGMRTVRRCNEKLDLVEKKMMVIAQDGTEEIFSP
ncbi:MAG: exodeoxyribonuclease VII small subunit [Lachnospiraceae bacterium]|nr:exodeoxyribonuclease VII small subunit [Lachnospiraceae bacterium]